MNLWILLAMICCVQSLDESEQPLPDWTHAPDQANLFLVQTDLLPTRLAADEALMRAAKADVIAWSMEKWGSDCGELLDAFPLEDYRKLIHDDQEFIHKERVQYDPETAERLSIPFDDLYRGFMRVEIDDKFCAAVEPKLAQRRLRNRLCLALVAATFFVGVLGLLWLKLYMVQVARGLYIRRINWIIWGLAALLVALCYGVYWLLF